MRTSLAIVGISAVAAALLTVGLRSTPSDGPGTAKAAAPISGSGALESEVSPASVQAWRDPSTSVQRVDEVRVIPASLEVTTPEPIVASTPSPPPEPTAAIPPVASPSSLAGARQRSDRTSRTEKPGRRSVPHAARHAEAQKPSVAAPGKTATVSAKSAPAKSQPQSTASDGGPLGDILRGLGLADGPVQQR